MNNYWHIEGYEGLTKFYDRKVKIGYFSDKQIQNLLQALSAKAGLDFDDIVGAYARKKTKISNELLSVSRDGTGPVYLCGENPHFIARAIYVENDL